VDNEDLALLEWLAIGAMLALGFCLAMMLLAAIAFGLWYWLILW